MRTPKRASTKSRSTADLEPNLTSPTKQGPMGDADRLRRRLLARLTELEGEVTRADALRRKSLDPDLGSRRGSSRPTKSSTILKLRPSPKSTRSKARWRASEPAHMVSASSAAAKFPRRGSRCSPALRPVSRALQQRRVAQPESNIMGARGQVGSLPSLPGHPYLFNKVSQDDRSFTVAKPHLSRSRRRPASQRTARL